MELGLDLFDRRAFSTCTQATSTAEYERKNSPSTLMDRMTKHGPKPRKYMRILVYFVCMHASVLKANGRTEEMTGKR